MIHKCDRSDFVLWSPQEKASHERSSERSVTTTGKIATTFLSKNLNKTTGKKEKKNLSHNRERELESDISVLNLSVPKGCIFLTY